MGKERNTHERCEIYAKNWRRKDNIKIYLNVCGMDSSGLGESAVSGFSRHVNELSGRILTVILDYLSYCELP
jgi:hypothetical protein